MNIFSFGIHFTDEKSYRLHFKVQETMKELFVNVVKDQHSTGSLINAAISIKPVILGNHFVARQ